MMLRAIHYAVILVPLDYIFREEAKFHEYERDEQGLYYTCDGLHHTPQSAELIAKAMLHCWNMED